LHRLKSKKNILASHYPGVAVAIDFLVVSASLGTPHPGICLMIILTINLLISRDLPVG